MGVWAPRLGLLLLVAAYLPCGLMAADKANDPKIDLRVVKYDDLEKSIAGHKGKIVIVDYWADT
jgi:hypothetical protein